MKDKKVEKDLQEIKKNLEQIKKKSSELSLVLPISSGKSIEKNFEKIVKKLDLMLAE